MTQTKTFHVVAFAIAGLMAGLSTQSVVAAPTDVARRPNIVFILADDFCSLDIGAYGNTEVQTPNIDRLAKRGTRFTRAYNMGSNQPAVCAASRRMLITGRYLWPSMQSADQEGMAQSVKAGSLWSQQLKRAGYATYFTGKWHIPCKPEAVFDHVTHVRGGMPGTVASSYNRPLEGAEDRWDPTDLKNGGFWQGGQHWSETLADDSTAFIQQACQSEQPFFMYLAFNAPHDPRQAPRKYLEMYDRERISIPTNFLPEYPYRDAIGVGYVDRQNHPFPVGTPLETVRQGEVLRDERLAPFPRTEHAIRTHRHEYYAIITHLDAQIGRILDALEKSGKLDNTIVVFTADQGLAAGRHGLMGKQNMYEHSLRTPFVIAGPTVPQGETRGTPIYLQDIVPTTLQLAGTEVGEHVQFRSLLPILKDDKAPHYPVIYGGYMSQQRAIISGAYKLILYPGIAKVRLYNLEDDPNEMKDLADDPTQRPRIWKLLKGFQQLQVEMQDELDVSAIYADWSLKSP